MTISHSKPIDNFAMARLAQFMSQEEYSIARQMYKRGFHRMAKQYQEKAAKLHQRAVQYIELLK